MALRSQIVHLHSCWHHDVVWFVNIHPSSTLCLSTGDTWHDERAECHNWCELCVCFRLLIVYFQHTRTFSCEFCKWLSVSVGWIASDLYDMMYCAQPNMLAPSKLFRLQSYIHCFVYFICRCSKWPWTWPQPLGSWPQHNKCFQCQPCSWICPQPRYFMALASLPMPYIEQYTVSCTLAKWWSLQVTMQANVFHVNTSVAF